MPTLTLDQLKMKIGEDFHSYVKSRGFRIRGETYAKVNRWTTSIYVGAEHFDGANRLPVPGDLTHYGLSPVIERLKLPSGEYLFLLRESNVKFRKPELTQNRAVNIFKTLIGLREATNLEELRTALTAGRDENTRITLNANKCHIAGSWLRGTGSFFQSNAEGTLLRSLELLDVNMPQNTNVQGTILNS